MAAVLTEENLRTYLLLYLIYKSLIDYVRRGMDWQEERFAYRPAPVCCPCGCWCNYGCSCNYGPGCDCCYCGYCGPMYGYYQYY